MFRILRNFEQNIDNIIVLESKTSLELLRIIFQLLQVYCFCDGLNLLPTLADFGCTILLCWINVPSALCTLKLLSSEHSWKTSLEQICSRLLLQPPLFAQLELLILLYLYIYIYISMYSSNKTLYYIFLLLFSLYLKINMDLKNKAQQAKEIILASDIGRWT